jgi:hypothetical protein
VHPKWGSPCISCGSGSSLAEDRRAVLVVCARLSNSKNMRKPLRCQATTVSGLTTSNVERQWRQKAGERDAEETIGGRESGALMNRAFEDSDLMAQSRDLDLEVMARTKDRNPS